MDQNTLKRAVHGPWGSAAGLMAEEDNIKDIERLFPYQEEPEKGRVLLSPLFLRKTVLDTVRSSLAGLRDLAAQDKGEWIEMLSAAVDDFDGRIHTDRVLERLPHVRRSIEEVEALAEGIDPALHRPLVEKYLSDEVLEQTGGLKYKKRDDAGLSSTQRHFTVREPPSAKKDRGAGSSGASSRAFPPVSKSPPASSGFGVLPKGRKRPAMPGSAPDAGMFLKPTKPKPAGVSGRAKTSDKRPVMLDISSVKQMQGVTKKRRVDLQAQRLEEKEREKETEKEKEKETENEAQAGGIASVGPSSDRASPPVSKALPASTNGRKRPAMPGSAPEAGMVVKPTKPKPAGVSARGAAPAKKVEKKPVVLDISSVKQMQGVTEKRRVDLQAHRLEEKEKEAQQRAEERQQKKGNLKELKKFMHDAEKRKKEAKREEERERKRPTKAPVEGGEVMAVLDAARNKANEVEGKAAANVDAWQADVDDVEGDCDDARDRLDEL